MSFFIFWSSRYQQTLAGKKLFLFSTRVTLRLVKNLKSIFSNRESHIFVVTTNRVYFKKECSPSKEKSFHSRLVPRSHFVPFPVSRSHVYKRTAPTLVQKKKTLRMRHAALLVLSIGWNRKWFYRLRLFFKRWKPRRSSRKEKKSATLLN